MTNKTELNENGLPLKTLTRKDVSKTYYRWWATAEVSNSFERMQALSVCASFTPALEKLYGDNDEELRSALHRHLAFFNTQAIWGGWIHGTVLAMEEQRANGENIPTEMITGIKTGLMGPLAGIGDTLDFGTVQTIFYALAASFALEGSFVGAIIIVLFSVLHFFLGLAFFQQGYTLGRESIKKVLESGLINTIIDGAGVLGMFMMGALSATMVKLSSPLVFGTAGKEIVLQEVLDKLAPGLMPLAAVLFVYWGMKYKKWSISKMLILLIVISLLGAAVGFF